MQRLLAANNLVLILLCTYETTSYNRFVCITPETQRGSTFERTNPTFPEFSIAAERATPSHLRGRRASILWQRPPCFSGADISETSLRAFSSVMTIPDIHQPRMYWSPQRGPTPEQKRVVSSVLKHAMSGRCILWICTTHILSNLLC